MPLLSFATALFVSNDADSYLHLKIFLGRLDIGSPSNLLHSFHFRSQQMTAKVRQAAERMLF